MRIRRLLLAAGILVSSCAVRPNYKRPATTPPSEFRGAEGAASQSLGDLP